MLGKLLKDKPGATLERDEHLPPTLSQLAWSVGRRLLVVAFMISLIIHLMGGFAAFFVRWGAPGRGSGGGDQAGAVEMALGGETELATLLAAPAGGVNIAAPEEFVPDAPTTNLSAETMLSVPESMSLTDGGIGTALSGGGEIGGDGIGGGGLGGSGGGGGTSFFGVEAAGTRIAYVVDFSASMEGERIKRLREELRKSVQGMGAGGQFLIVTFSDRAAVLGGKREWTDSAGSAQRRLMGSLETMELGPSTQPLPGFEITFSTKPAPDAIYFMTDGEFAEDVVEQVAIMNRKNGALIPIHCIAFESTAGEDLMRRIAEMSRGTYTYVAGP
ncbi:MAG TPA: hypothetical protein VD971_00375 [Phycisphaerales bacterium]|nr:hypothetical protein [Phycisphaerales bacterium]